MTVHRASEEEKVNIMKAMIAGFVAVFVIAIGANVILERSGFGSAEKFSGQAVRLN